MSVRKNGTDTAVRGEREGNFAGAGSLGLAAPGRQAQGGAARTEHGHRERRGDRGSIRRQGPHPVRAGTIRRRASRPTKSCWRHRPAASYREFQSRHLLRKAGPLAGSHRRLPEGSRNRSAAQRSAVGPGHLPAASGEAGAGHRLLRQSAGARSRIMKRRCSAKRFRCNCCGSSTKPRRCI